MAVQIRPWLEAYVLIRDISRASAEGFDTEAMWGGGSSASLKRVWPTLHVVVVNTMSNSVAEGSGAIFGLSCHRGLSVSRRVTSITLKRSSRVMPGFRGTPAGMMTTSAPFKASGSSSGPA